MTINNINDLLVKLDRSELEYLVDNLDFYEYIIFEVSITNSDCTVTYDFVEDLYTEDIEDTLFVGMNYLYLISDIVDDIMEVYHAN